jgi:hypothetical protein
MFSILAGIGSVCSTIILEDLRKSNFNSTKVEHTAVDRTKEMELFEND